MDVEGGEILLDDEGEFVDLVWPVVEKCFSFSDCMNDMLAEHRYPTVELSTDVVRVVPASP